LPAFVHPHQLRDVIVAVAEIFRDSDELRLNRAKARMKFLFLNHGWTPKRMLAEVERRLGYSLDAPADDTAPEGSDRDHVGVHAQKQAGLYYAGLSVLSGRVTPVQLRRAAALAEEFGDGSLRLTAMQNIVILNVAGANVAPLVSEAHDAELPLAGSSFQRGTVSCTGSEFCKLAITETKKFSVRLAHELEARMPGFNSDIKLHITGCPNSCGQHWIADVGLQGVLMTRGDAQVEGYDVFVGGALGKDSAVARRLGYRVPANETAEALTRLFSTFSADRIGLEPFSAWVNRTPDVDLRAVLAGETAGASA